MKERIAKNISKYLTTIDIFRTTYNLSYNRKRAYKSSLGGILTILLFAFITATIVILGSELFYKKQPKVVSYTSIKSNSVIDFKLPLAVSIYDINNNQIDIYKNQNIEIYFYINTSNLNMGLELPGRICKFQDFNLSIEEFNNNNLGGALCISDLLNYDTNIEGYWINKNMKFIGIYIGPCKQGRRQNVTCNNLSDIRTFLFENPIAIQIQIQQFVYNPVNYTYPFSYYIKNNGYMIDPTTYLQIERYVGIFDLQTDSGIFFPSFNNESKQELREEMYIQSNNFSFASVQNLFIQYVFCASPNITISQRTYLNLTTLISQIGGLISIIYQIINFLTESLYKNLMSEEIVDIIFDVDASKKASDEKLISLKNACGREKLIFIHKSERRGDINKNSQNQNSINENKSVMKLNPKLMNINKSVAFRPMFVDNSEKLLLNKFSQAKELRKYILEKENFNIENTLFDDDIIKSKKIKSFNYCHFISYYFCRCIASMKVKNRMKMFHELDKITMDYTDIVNIVKTQYGLEKLKYLLLDEIQLAIINSGGKLVNPLNIEDKSKLTSFSKMFLNSRNLKVQKSLLSKYLSSLNEEIVVNSSELDQRLILLWEQ